MALLTLAVFQYPVKHEQLEQTRHLSLQKLIVHTPDQVAKMRCRFFPNTMLLCAS